MKTPLMYQAFLRMVVPKSRRNISPKNPLEGLDIDAEYKLIQNKQSQLPSSKRRMIVAIKEFKAKPKKK